MPLSGSWLSSSSYRLLLGGESAVQDKAAADGKGTLLARQEQRPVGDLARIGNPVDGRPCRLGSGDFRGLQAVVDLGLQQGRAGDPRAERIHPDIVADQV